MGRRYSAILKHLNIVHVGIDIDTPDDQVALKAKMSDAFIIATPTFMHEGHIEFFSTFNKPILCEKPICIGIPELAVRKNSLIQMVAQYKFLSPWDYYRDQADSYYDYWNSGKDGLVWDAIQIIGLAKGKISLANDSPIWRCKINHHTYQIQSMDSAYIAMIKKWTMGDNICGYDEFMEWHHKTLEFENNYEASQNCNTGKVLI